MTRTDLHSQLSVLLGGRSAEEIAFDEISTGAQNDLQRATDIARAMVTEFGMSDSIGAITYDGHRRAAFLDMPIPAGARHLRRRDGAQDRSRGQADPLRGAREVAPHPPRSTASTLDTLSERLLEKEVIEADELKAILGPVPPKDENALPAEVPPVG